MYKNKFLHIALLSLACSSCAWNPVMTPYAYTPATTSSPADTATIWGGADGAENYFLEIDGRSLPSRQGGGYPLSVTVPAGSYTVRLFYQSNIYHAEAHLPITVEAGHTYTVKNVMRNVGGRLRWDPILDDLGQGKVCHYERLNQVRGDVKLICQQVVGS